MLLLVLAACAPDLPAGWEDAEPIRDLVQSPCEGSPYDPEQIETEVTATRAGDAVEVEAEPVVFRCEQAVEGFWKAVDGGVAALLQPEDMHPTVVAACDCTFRFTFSVPDADATYVEVWRRWDDWNDPNDPVPAGAATVE